MTASGGSNWVALGDAALVLQALAGALVGVPPEVTDLNIALQPLPNCLYMPMIKR